MQQVNQPNWSHICISHLVPQFPLGATLHCKLIKFFFFCFKKCFPLTAIKKSNFLSLLDYRDKLYMHPSVSA